MKNVPVNFKFKLVRAARRSNFRLSRSRPRSQIIVLRVTQHDLFEQQHTRNSYATMLAVTTLPTAPIAGQKPGTSGLRKKTKVFMQGL